MTDAELIAVARPCCGYVDTLCPATASLLIRLCDALAAHQWQPIETAPRDRPAIVWAAPHEGLPGFVTWCQWTPCAGWCADELRVVTHWMPLPAPPTAEGPTT